jgi:hypothetical protein
MRDSIGPDRDRIHSDDSNSSGQALK